MQTCNQVFNLLLLITVISLPIHGQEGRLQQAEVFFANGKYTEAGLIYEQEMKSPSAGEKIYMRAAECAIRSDNYLKGIAILEQSGTKHGQTYHSKMLLSQLYLKAGKTSRAIDMLMTMSKQFPDSTALRTQLALIYFSRASGNLQYEKWDAGIQDLKSALFYDAGLTDARKNLVILYLRKQEFAFAYPHAKKLYTSAPTDSICRQLFLETLLGLQSYEEAIAVAEKAMESSPGNIQAGLNYALVLRADQQQTKAADIYRLLRTRFPGVKPVYQAENEMFRLQKKYDSIIVRSNEYLQHFGTDKEIMLELAFALEKKSLYDSARAVYQRLVQTDIDRDAALLIAESYMKEDNPATAIAEYSSYLYKGGRNSDAITRAAALLSSQGRIAEAKQLMQHVFTTHPQATGACIELVKLHYYDGQTDSAWSWLSAIKYEYNAHPEISYYTALQRLELNDTTSARFQATRAIRNLIEEAQSRQTMLSAQIQASRSGSPDSSLALKSGRALLDSVRFTLVAGFTLLKRVTTPAQYVQVLSKLIEEMPGTSLLYLKRAEAHAAAGNTQTAAADYDNAVQFGAMSEVVYRSAAEFFESIQNLEKALLMYKIAFGFKKNDPFYLQKILDLSTCNGSVGELCDYWLIVYHNDKTNIPLKEYLVLALRKAGRGTEAVELLKTAQ